MILIYIILIILFLYNNQNLVKRYIPFEKFVHKEEEEKCAEEEKMLNEYKDKVEKAIELVSTLNNKVNELDNSIKDSNGVAISNLYYKKSIDSLVSAKTILKEFADISVPIWSGAQMSNAKLGMAHAATLK